MIDPAALIRKIEAREAVVGIVGLGYVGLPVAVAFAEAGFEVVGVDLDPERVEALRSGHSYLGDVPDDVIVRWVGTRLGASSSFAKLRDADVVMISVPTPLSDGVPDLSRVVSAGQALGKVLKKGSLVILESTTYPGTTEELLKPLLEAEGAQAGADFLLAYSPERIDPGNPVYAFGDIPKVVGGMDEASTAAAARIYEQVVPKVVTVSGTREAELAKLIENTFRHVNIALVNELAVYAHEMGVDIWESIEAAASKPFGFLPFWPGPGWGGHCIPLDPAYLSWRVRQDRAHEVRFVELAHAVNSEMPRHVVDRIGLLLNEHHKPLRGSKVLAIGVAYKGGTEDTRESPALKILSTLVRRGVSVTYHDPLVPTIDIGGSAATSVALDEAALVEADLVVIFIPQSGVDWELVARSGRMIFDCCNALGKTSASIYRL